MKNIIEPMLGAIGLGGGEILLILLSLICSVLVIGALIFFAIKLLKSSEKKIPSVPPVHQPPVAASTQVMPRKCPQCGAALQPDVPEGLCPACLLQRGMGTEGGAPPGTPPFVPPTIPELGKLFPQLEILELIGQGGMGAVYKARQPALDRFVALKILAPRSGGDVDFAGRFNREARALARLSHPNIVGVYDFGIVAQASSLSVENKERTGGKPVPLNYFIMEFVDGPNLRQAGKLSTREAMEIIPQICTALQFAHDEGIVHRDIKPENVMLDKKGRVKIADFGLAKIMGQGDFRMTGTKDVMGTPHYMAPEQVEKPQEVDHRADIYSLGVVFYEMLTGELPLGKFQSPSQKVQVDVRLDEVVLRSLAKEPELRYQHVSEVGTRVETIASTPSGGGPVSLPGEMKPIGNDSGQPTFSAGVIAFRRGVLIALWVFGLILAASVVITLLLPKDYIATARVRLNGPTGGDPYHLQTELEVIQSVPVLDKAVAVANLRERWARKFYGGGELSDDAAVVLMKQMIEVQPVRNSELAEIHFHSDSPAEAAELANDVAEAYCTRSSEPAGEIIERAIAPRHPARPNLPLNIFLGALSGAGLGLFAGFLVGLFSYLWNGPARAERGKAVQAPDLFWRRFAVVMACVVLIPIIIAIFGMLAAVAIPAFVRARIGAQEIHRQNTVMLREGATSSHIGKTWFPKGDSIEIVSVERSPDRLVVKGRYHLVSTERAQLTLNVTSTNGETVRDDPSQSSQSIQIGGRGNFELTRALPVAGLPHVSMYANGESFADIYFGTEAEAREESKLDLGSPGTSTETWSPPLFPGEKPDLQKILQDATKLREVEHFEEALQRHLWYHRHALEYDPAQTGVRLSFALSDWVALGNLYPKAKQALLEIRDADAQALAKGTGTFNLLMDVNSINDYLHEGEATRRLFETIEQRDPSLAKQGFGLVAGLLVQHGDYEKCLKYIGDPQAEFEAIHQSRERLKQQEEQSSIRRAEQNKNLEHFWDMAKTNSTHANAPKPALPELPKFADENFIGQTRQLIEILVGAKHKADAEKIRDQAVTILDDARLKSAVSDAEQKIAQRRDK